MLNYDKGGDSVTCDDGCESSNKFRLKTFLVLEAVIFVRRGAGSWGVVTTERWL